MRFALSIKIDNDNEAFQPHPRYEVAPLLHAAARRVLDEGEFELPDINGVMVLLAGYVPEDEREKHGNAGK